MTTLRHLWFALGMMVVLVGCTANNEDSWHSKDISGLMPELEFELTGTDNQTITAADSEGTVRLLYFGFTSCPDVCPTTLAKLQTAIRQLPEPQRDAVTTLFVSVDPRRDTPERLASYVDFFGERIVGLTGNEPALRKLSKRYRTTFGYDEPDAQGNYNVSHSSAVYIFDRTGDARLLLRSDLTAQQIRDDLETLVSD